GLPACPPSHAPHPRSPSPLHPLPRRLGPTRSADGLRNAPARRFLAAGRGRARPRLPCLRLRLSLPLVSLPRSPPAASESPPHRHHLGGSRGGWRRAPRSPRVVSHSPLWTAAPEPRSTRRPRRDSLPALRGPPLHGARFCRIPRRRTARRRG